MNARTAAVQLSALLALASIPPAPAPAATVVGRVFDSTERKPLGFAMVVVVGTRRGAHADEDGTFRITDVPEGTYTLRIELPGLRRASQEIVVRAGENRLGDVLVAKPAPPAPVEIGTRTPVRAEDLVVTIRPMSNRFVVGDSPAFEVRIHNRSAEPALLVQSVDASDAWASPAVTIDIGGPEGGFRSGGGARCGNNNGVNPDDFVEVPPGGSFDPYAGGWVGANVRDGKFALPGKYTATFRYRTTNTDARTWMGGPCTDCEMGATYRDLLARVPAVELEAKTSFHVLR